MADQASSAAASPAPKPAVSELLRGAATPPTPVTPIRPTAATGRSQHPEAVRARERRAKASGRSAALPRAAESDRTGPGETTGGVNGAPGAKFTPAAARDHLALVPRETPAPTSDQVARAERNWTRIVQGIGQIASTILKSEALLVPEVDARDAATQILKGWPELVLASDQDFEKVMAGVVVGSIGFERWRLYQRDRDARGKEKPTVAPIAAAPAAVSRSTAGPTMQPIALV